MTAPVPLLGAFRHAHEAMAESLAEATGLPVTAVDGGFRVKTTETHYIDVIRQLFNWRVTTTPKDNPLLYDRYWCFAGTGWLTLLTAVMAVADWDGSEDSEPEGWNKNGQTKEWRAPGGETA